MTPDDLREMYRQIPAAIVVLIGLGAFLVLMFTLVPGPVPA